MKRIAHFVALLLIWTLCGAPSCGGGGGVKGGGGGNPPGDTTPPTVSSTAPANGAVGVPTNISSITANFSEEIVPSTLIFTVNNGGSVSGTVSYSGTTAVFAPLSDLASNTTFTATITTGVKDLAGNSMASNYTWTFTTGSAPDTTLPTVISTSPISNATDAATDTNITSTFSEKMDVNTPYLIVQKNGEPPMGGTVSYSDVTNTVTFTPSQPLISNATHTATVPSSAKDLAGNNMAADYVWTFTTKPPVPKIYVANERSSGSYTTVSRIDPSDNSVINVNMDQNIGGYGSPVNVSVNANKAKAYVTMFDSMIHAVHVIKTGTDTKSSPIDINEFAALPQGGVVDPNTDYLYVSTKLNDIRVINGTTGAPIATISNVTACGHMLLNPGANELYCLAGNNDKTVAIINTVDNTVKATVTVGSGPNGAVVDPATNRLYISNGYSDTISVINLANRTVVTLTLPAGTGPWGLAIDNDKMYIVAYYQDNLLVMDLTGPNQYTITDSELTGGDGPLYLVLYNGKAYVTNWGAWYSGEVVCDNKVSVINLNPFAFETTIPVGNCPIGLDIYIP